MNQGRFGCCFRTSRSPTLPAPTSATVTIWQRANIVLVGLAGADPGAAEHYQAAVENHRDAVTAADARLVVTRDAIACLPAPCVVIGDRWGEVQHLTSADSFLTAPPAPAELLEWLHYVQMRCPECEGEWR